MSKALIAVAVSIIGICAGAQNAVAANNLFKNYAYDSPITNYTEAAGYYDCSADLGTTARCIDDVDFIDQKFNASLIFTGDKLTMVSLVAPYDVDVYSRAMGALGKTFLLAVMADGKSLLDLVELSGKVKNKEEYVSKLRNYESVALNANELTYTFFEGVTSFKGLSSAHSLMAAAPDNIRSVDLIVASEEGESDIFIKFSFPKLDEAKQLEQVNKPVESF